MTPETPDTADSQRAINAAQQKLDAEDGKTDGKIDHPKAEAVSDEDKQKLTALYIGKVNDLQGRIADTRHTVEIAKNARAPWQALERACGHAESGLLECMAKVDPKTMHETVDAFDVELTALLEKFLVSSSEKNEKTETGTPIKAEVLMKELGLPQDGSDVLIKSAVEHYGEDGIRAVYANMELTSRVPESIHSEHFGCPPVKMGKGVESAKIAILLGNGSLENSPYRYLLQDPAGKVRGVREGARDRSARVQSRMDTIKAQELQHIQQLVEETKNATYEWKDTLVNLLRAEAYIAAPFLSSQIDAILPSKIDAEEAGIRIHVKAITQLRTSSDTVKAEKDAVDGIATVLDTALAVHRAEEARLSGRTEESDRRMMQLLEKHGEDLKSIDPSLAKRATKSAVRLRDQKKLTPAEEALLFDDPRSPEALRKAIEQKASESSAVDVLDQVRAKQTFRAGSFEKYAPPKGSVIYDGRDVSGALGIGARTTLHYSNGRSLNVIVTPQAQRVLEKLPPDKEPVLLRPISSMNMVGGSGRGNTRTFLKNAPSDFIVQHTDIGFIDTSGNVVRDDQKTPFDLSQNENRSMIEKQTRNQKGFRLEAYQPKLPLRTMKNEPYPYGLNTLKTQSGVTVEGVTVAQDAIGLINAEPPQGETLVLKRIPRAIVLRTPDLEKGSRQHQKVLSVDMVSKQDLGYAKIDGDTLVTRDVPKGKKPDASVVSSEQESTEVKKPIVEIEKEQEEKTRDIQRVLDRNPAMKNVKNTASTIQQTVGHLQKFLEASKSGSAREEFVKFARSEAKPTLDMLKDPQLKQDIDQARSALLALKGVNGIALGGLEKKIDEQLKALDGFSAMLVDGRTENLLRTITDESKFSADNWKNFFANELPVIVASIVLACAAAAFVVATCGAGFVAIAAATALGGVIGAELGKETVYYGHQYLDSDVRSGRATFTNRSNVGLWKTGQQNFDEKTRQFRQREFWVDVACPFAKDFAIGFATTLATMGIGNIAGAQLSKLLQNGEVVKKLAGRSDIMKAVARKLASLNKNHEVLEKAANLKEAITRALKSLPKEIGEEFGDEAQENILEKFLNQIDIGLAVGSSLDGKITAGNLAAVLLATFKGTRIGKATISYEVRGKTPESIAARSQAIRSEAEANGGIVTNLGKGVLSIRQPVEGPNGTVQYETVQMEPATVDVDGSINTDGKPDSSDADIPKLLALKGLLEGKGKTLEEVHAALGIDFTAPEHQAKIAEIMRVHEMVPTGTNAETGEKEYSPSDIQDKALGLKAAGFKVDQIDYLIREGICGFEMFFKAPPFRKSADREQRPNQSGDLLKRGTVVRNASGTWRVLGQDQDGLYRLEPHDVETVQKWGSDFWMLSPRSALDIVQTNIAPEPKRKSVEPRPAPERDQEAPKDSLRNPPTPNIHLAVGDRVKVKLPEGGVIDCHIVKIENGEAVVINGEGMGYRHRRVPVEQLRSWNQPENFVRKPFMVGEEVYTRRTNGVYEKGWKIAENPTGTYILHNQDQHIERDFDPREVFHIDELENGRLPGDLHIEPAARMILKQHDVLQRHAALTEQRFHQLFDGDFSQANVGNCYLIAAFNSVRASPQFEAIMRTCVKETEGGYFVYLPLGTSFDQQRQIRVSRDDLKPQTVLRDGKRVQLLPVQSSMGWQVIEAAFAIDKFGSVDRQKMSGGLGDQALVQLFGEGVETQAIRATQQGEMDLSKPFASADPSGRKTVEEWLENFNNGKDIATVNTPRTESGDDRQTFRIGHNEFYKNHAYSVESVDKIRRTVTVVNPHDTSAPIKLSYDEFFRTFSDVSSVNLEYAKMFRGLTGRQGRREGGNVLPIDNVRPRRQTVAPFRNVASSAEVAGSQAVEENVNGARAQEIEAEPEAVKVPPDSGNIATGTKDVSEPDIIGPDVSMDMKGVEQVSAGDLQKKLNILDDASQKMDLTDLEGKILVSFREFVSQHPEITSNDISEMQTKKGNEPLMKEGDAYDGVYILLEGAIDIDVDGEIIHRPAPAVCGEIGAITGKRTATVKPSGSVSYIKISKEFYGKFLKEKMLPELRKLVIDRIKPSQDPIKDKIGSYPEALKPTNPDTEKKNALLFWTLRHGIAPLYTKEALQDAEAEWNKLGINPTSEARLAYEACLLKQAHEPDAVEANQTRWHEWGVWEHTRQVGNAVQHLPFLDPKHVAQDFLQELKAEEEEIDGLSKYDLMLFSLTLHDLGKAKPIVGRSPKTGDIYPSHLNHEQRSEDLILRAMKNDGTPKTEADIRLRSLLEGELQLAPKQIEYIGRLAALHFEFGVVRREAGKDFNMKFMESPAFKKACDDIFKDTDGEDKENRKEYLREIGLLFLLDTAGKTPKETWKVDEVEEGELPTDEQLDRMKEKWKRTDRPGLVDAYTSFQTSRATALRFLEILKQKRTIEGAKTSDEGRAAMLEYMKETDVNDAARLEIAQQLLGLSELTQEQSDAILEAHTHGEGNLQEGYSQDERIVKGAKLIQKGGLTREQAQLLLDTGVCGNIPPPPPGYKPQPIPPPPRPTGTPTNAPAPINAPKPAQNAVQQTFKIPPAPPPRPSVSSANTVPPAQQNVAPVAPLKKPPKAAEAPEAIPRQQSKPPEQAKPRLRPEVEDAYKNALKRTNTREEQPLAPGLADSLNELHGKCPITMALHFNDGSRKGRKGANSYSQNTNALTPWQQQYECANIGNIEGRKFLQQKDPDDVIHEGTHWPTGAFGSKEYKQELETMNTQIPSQIEGVTKLSPNVVNGKDTALIYRFRDSQYYDSRGSRPGAEMGVTLLLPPAKADVVFKQLTENPSMARGFFLAMLDTPDLEFRDYVFNERIPNCSLAPKSKIFFMEQDKGYGRTVATAEYVNKPSATDPASLPNNTPIAPMAPTSSPTEKSPPKQLKETPKKESSSPPKPSEASTPPQEVRIGSLQISKLSTKSLGAEIPATVADLLQSGFKEAKPLMTPTYKVLTMGGKSRQLVPFIGRTEGAMGVPVGEVSYFYHPSGAQVIRVRATDKKEYFYIRELPRE